MRGDQVTVGAQPAEEPRDGQLAVGSEAERTNFNHIEAALAQQPCDLTTGEQVQGHRREALVGRHQKVAGDAAAQRAIRVSVYHLLGAANLIPGPTSTELAMHIGHRRAGRAGLVAAGLAFLLPAVLIVGALAEV